MPENKSGDPEGRVVGTRGRRVLVRDAQGERVCFLSGHRVVIGDRVTWVEARGEGGKITGVLPRERALGRADFKGREQVVAANLGGLLVMSSAKHPPYRSGLIDRYQLAALQAGVEVALVLSKADLGVDEEVEADLAWRESLGVPVFRTVPTTGEGIEAVRTFLAAHAAEGPWALVGHSGVGKTSLIHALLPEADVGPMGAVSEYWDTGTHSTTHSRLFELAPGVEIADSPGIRTFLPSGLSPALVKLLFPGMGGVGCRYRDCLHRPGEDGCNAEAEVDEALLARYRRLLGEVVEIDQRSKPGGSR